MIEYYLIGIALFFLLLIVFSRFMNKEEEHPEHDLYRSIVSGTTELVVPSNGGLVINSNNGSQKLRCSGSTTTYSFSGPSSTLNQIQFFTNNNCVAAFDVSSLLISESYHVNIGTNTNYLQLVHSATSSITSDSTIGFLSGATPILTLSSSDVTTSVPLTVTNDVIVSGAVTGCSTINGPLAITNGTSSTFEITSAMLALGNASVASCLSNFGGASSKIKIGGQSLIYYIYNTIL